MLQKSYFFFQFAVPKNGGLHVAMLTQKGQETRGLPTTVIKMLPVEVMVFVDMIPYVFANRHHGKHIFWTSMAALVNYKKWIDAALETKDLDFLNQVLTCLKTKRFNSIVETMAERGRMRGHRFRHRGFGEGKLFGTRRDHKNGTF